MSTVNDNDKHGGTVNDNDKHGANTFPSRTTSPADLGPKRDTGVCTEALAMSFMTCVLA